MKKVEESLSLCRINLELPSDWKDISQRDLKFLFVLMANGCSHFMIVAKMIERFSGIKYIGGGMLKKKKRIFVIDMDQWIALYHTLEWVNTIPPYPIAIRSLKGRKAIDPLLMDVPFKSYLMIDNLFAQLIQNSVDYKAAAKLFNILYPKRWYNINPWLSIEEVTALVVWVSSLKKFFARHFSDLFAHASDSDNSGEINLEQIMNSQIRALTAGDVTKEKEVLAMDTWRALTELNAKAKEARELNERMKK